MMERKEYPIGIVLFIVFFIVLAVFNLFYLVYYQMFAHDSLTAFLSFSIRSIVMWTEALLWLLSLIVIPYGFMRRKNWARLYGLGVLSWSAFLSLASLNMTGEKIIQFPLFVMYVLFIMFLLMSSVKRYFGKTSLAIVPSDPMKEYTYGPYTLYSKLVRLKNKKMQIIYYFSIRKPKSGTPTPFPYGFEVETSKRSGLPYLKKK